MWLITPFEAVTLFSLKMSTATASGGKTLLAPTPFAIKMALVDVACKVNGLAAARVQWEAIRALAVALDPAPRAVVTNLFQKVLRPRRNPIPLEEADSGFFQRTIGYREYVHLEGQMRIALGWEGAEERTWLADLIPHITYLGKRGSFMQMTAKPQHYEQLLPGFVSLTQETAEFPINGTLQVLDDCAVGVPFEKVDIYSGKGMQLGKDRILRNIILPYRIQKSSRSYTVYFRSD